MSQDDTKGAKLAYDDPGTQRGLPAPSVHTLVGGERVRLKRAQTYADGVVIREGEEGVTLNPSSQAAHWCVRFPKAGGGKPRVVPEWQLQRLDAAPLAH